MDSGLAIMQLRLWAAIVNNAAFFNPATQHPYLRTISATDKPKPTKPTQLKTTNMNLKH
jgi:hypothetical protein